MSTTANRAPELLSGDADANDWRETVRKSLLACGVVSVFVYVGWHEIAALQWEGYSRIANAISELHLTGTPSKWLLDPWEGIVYNALLIAFGIGVWLSAQGKRPLRVVGGFLVLAGATTPLWPLFGEASLAAHLILVIVSIVAMLGQMAFGAAAFGRRFRWYSLVTLATVVVSYGLALAYAPAVAAGDPTPYIGLYERVGFSAYFLWTLVLCAALWRGPADQDVPSSDAPLARPPA